MPGDAGLNLGVRIAFDAESAESVICRIFAGGLKMSAADVGTGMLCCIAKTVSVVRVEHDEICSCCCYEQLSIPNTEHLLARSRQTQCNTAAKPWALPEPFGS